MDDGLPVPSAQLYDLESRLEKLFLNRFGTCFKEYLPDIVGNDFIDKRISYLEYATHIKIADADALMKKLKTYSFSKEQLDINCFDKFFIRNSTPAITINKLDHNTIRLCVKCKETALKAIYKKYAQPHVGIPASILLNKENAAKTIYKQILKYTKPDIINELNEEKILTAL